jgi:hypothetical protein
MTRPLGFMRLATLVLTASLLATAAPGWSASQFQDGTWSAIDPSSLAPGARREYAAIYDNVNQRYLIFAGFFGDLQGTYQLFNEVWTLSLGPTPTWGHLAIPGLTPGERHSPQWGYDPARNRVLVFGGYGRHYPGGPYEYLNDIWQLSLDGTPTWTELAPSGTPPTGRLAGVATYDVYRQRFVGFGGTLNVPVDTWELDLSGDPAWSTVETDSTSPKGSYGMTSIYDLVNDRMVIFGGSTSDDYYGVHNDVWELSLREETPTWNKLAPLGPPPIARRTLTSVYDPLRDRMVVFGGWDATENGTASFLNDTWALSLSETPQWTQLAPTGGPPAGRDAMAAIYDPLGDRMVVFGGWSGVQMLGDTWFLDWGGAPQAASMIASTQADPGTVRVHWNIQNATGSHAAVYRRAAGTPWASLATVEADASGVVTFEDDSVTPGGRYGYLLVVPSELGGQFGGETWVDIPTIVDVVPAGGIEFALNRVGPNPVTDRFTVSFALPAAESARLDLFDIAGRRVLSREVGSLGVGTHVVEMGTAREFRPGIYLIRLTQSNRSLTERVVITGGK